MTRIRNKEESNHIFLKFAFVWNPYQFDFFNYRYFLVQLLCDSAIKNSENYYVSYYIFNIFLKSVKIYYACTHNYNSNLDMQKKSRACKYATRL